MGFQCILLDLDNTLYDFVLAKEKACKRIIEEIGTGDPDELMKAFMFSPLGPENPLVIRSFLAKKNITEESDVLHAINVYNEAKISAIVPYPGVYETIKKIRNSGMKIGAITNASTEHATGRLIRIQVINLLDCLVTPDNSGYKKPDSSMFIHTALLLQVEPHQILVIGDNLVNDIRPAQQAGMCTIHAEYGNRLPSEYSEGIIPDFSVTSFPEILQIIGI